MPYVEQFERPELNTVVDAMKRANVQANGDLNYILFKYFKDTVIMKGKMGYNICKNYRAELQEAREEIGRRFLHDYEDMKRDQNGDV